MKYVLVQWPESQDFMNHPRFNECYLVDATFDDNIGSSAYMVPEDIYEEWISQY